MLFRTSVLGCLIQRRDCCAREQSDPIFTEPEFSHCTFCFQNTEEYSKIFSRLKKILLETREEITEIFHRGLKSFQKNLVVK